MNVKRPYHFKQQRAKPRWQKAETWTTLVEADAALADALDDPEGLSAPMMVWRHHLKRLAAILQLEHVAGAMLDIEDPTHLRETWLKEAR